MCYQLDWVVAVETLERWKVNKRSFWFYLVWRVKFNVLLFPSIFFLPLSLLLLSTVAIHNAHICILFISSSSMPSASDNSSCTGVCIIRIVNRESDHDRIHHCAVYNDNNGKNVTVSRQNVVFNGPYMSRGGGRGGSLLIQFLFLLSCLIRSKT